MDLNLAAPSGKHRGRPKLDLEVVEMGELTVEDLAALSAGGGLKAIPIKKLSERHHALARSMAAGMGQREAAYQHAYTPTRVGMLMRDAAFMELVEHYRVIPDAMYADLHERLSGLSIDAADEIGRRMEEDSNRDDGVDPKISFGQLRDIMTVAADRTGFGPATKSTHIHLHANLAEKLEAARKRVDLLRKAEVEETSCEQI